MEIAFTDIPPNFSPNSPNATSRVLDIRKIDGLITPKDQFFAVQHLGRPDIDGSAHWLKFTGLVKKAVEFSMPDLRGMPSVEVVAGYECSGNSSRSVQGLASCGRFAGVPLTNLLSHVGIGSRARELVFFGADHGIQDVVFRGQTFKLVQQFGPTYSIRQVFFRLSNHFARSWKKRVLRAVAFWNQARDYLRCQHCYRIPP